MGSVAIVVPGIRIVVHPVITKSNIIINKIKMIIVNTRVYDRNQDGRIADGGVPSVVRLYYAWSPLLWPVWIVRDKTSLKLDVWFYVP